MTHCSRRFACIGLVVCIQLLLVNARAQNQVLGELQLQGSTDAEKTAGVWVDGQICLVIRIRQ
jgi:hypothetical protein